MYYNALGQTAAGNVASWEAHTLEYLISEMSGISIGREQFSQKLVSVWSKLLE